MASPNEISVFQSLIIDWFLSYGRTFIWRDEDISAYEIIISEVLLQRTKAETIAKFFPSFLKKYPGWASIVDTATQQLEADLQPIGLYRQRAKRIKLLAREMYSRNGIIPNNRSELDEIAMLGQYIANAIELQIFKRNKPLLDVNMARVLERYFGPRSLADIRYDPYLQNLAHAVVNTVDSKIVNWAILDFAALICKSRRPLCEKCFLSNSCKYYKNISL